MKKYGELNIDWESKFNPLDGPCDDKKVTVNDEGVPSGMKVDYLREIVENACKRSIDENEGAIRSDDVLRINMETYIANSLACRLGVDAQDVQAFFKYIKEEWGLGEYLRYDNFKSTEEGVSRQKIYIPDEFFELCEKTNITINPELIRERRQAAIGHGFEVHRIDFTGKHNTFDPYALYELDVEAEELGFEDESDYILHTDKLKKLASNIDNMMSVVQDITEWKKDGQTKNKLLEIIKKYGDADK